MIRIFEKEGDDENQLCSELGPGDSEMNNKQSLLLIESDKRREEASQNSEFTAISTESNTFHVTIAQMAVANPTWRKSEISVDVLVNILLLTCLRYEFARGRKIRGLVGDMLPLRYNIQV